jgi:hypothetical protein
MSTMDYDPEETVAVASAAFGRSYSADSERLHSFDDMTRQGNDIPSKRIVPVLDAPTPNSVNDRRHSAAVSLQVTPIEMLEGKFVVHGHGVRDRGLLFVLRSASQELALRYI